MTFSSIEFANSGVVIRGNNVAVANSITVDAGVTDIQFCPGNLSLHGPVAPGSLSLHGPVVVDVEAGGSLTLGGAGDGAYWCSGGLSDDGATPGSLEKTGPGTLTLGGASNYTGGTTITSGDMNVPVSSYINNTVAGNVALNGGNLCVNGTIIGNVTVNNGGTLSGTGTVVGNVTVNGGNVSPGDNSVGVLTTANITFNGGTYSVQLADGTTPCNAVQATGTVDLGSGENSATLNLTGSRVQAAVDEALKLIVNEGPAAISGIFANLPEGSQLRKKTRITI